MKSRLCSERDSISKLSELVGEPTPDKDRLCAICLTYVNRSKYDAHCKDVHNFETFHINEIPPL